MKIKRLLKIANTAFFIWLVHFLIYNTYFGWNLEPQSVAEVHQDTVSRFLIYVALIADFLAIMRATRWVAEQIEPEKKDKGWGHDDLLDN